MNTPLILQILSLIESAAPDFVQLWQSFKASGQTVDQYVADIQARDAAASAAADAQIAADQKQIQGNTTAAPATPQS